MESQSMRRFGAMGRESSLDRLTIWTPLQEASNRARAQAARNSGQVSVAAYTALQKIGAKHNLSFFRRTCMRTRAIMGARFDKATRAGETVPLVNPARQQASAEACGLFETHPALHHSHFAPFPQLEREIFVFWFLVCYAATPLALKLYQERIQVLNVCVLLDFFKPILGNCYGPRVSSCQ